MTSSLSKSELLRYSRQLLLPEVGMEGQARLKKASVLVVGAGGLGSPLILYLAAAGFGTIGVVDFDRVDRSNLQRQIIYIDGDVGASKAERASEHAARLNPEISMVRHELRLSANNALDLLKNYDVIVDGTDNFSTRYLVNDACVLLKKPNVHGAIYRFEGQASVFSHQGGPCYRCLFPEPPQPDAVPNCAEGGVLGVMAGVIGCIQATEAIKIILGAGETLAGRLLLYDALGMRFDTLPIPKSKECPVCGESPRITKLEDIAVVCQDRDDSMKQKIITAIELQNELKQGRFLVLLDVRTPEEVALCRIPNSIHIPLAELTERIGELNAGDDIVLYCKSGARSMKAMHMLIDRGFQKARNLTGGIMSWSRDVDPSCCVY